jgi:hypothetical protein
MLAFHHGDGPAAAPATPLARALRRGLLGLLAAVTAGLLAANCGGGDDDDGPGGAFNCADQFGARCGTPCMNDPACGAGLFCSNGACAAQCSGDRGCGGGQSCSTQGRCVGGTGGAGGSGGSGGSLGVMGSGGGGGNGGQGGQCAGVAVQFTPIIPLISFLIDKSGSMGCPIESAVDNCEKNDPAAPNSRWLSMKNALLADGGALKQLESKAYFGVSFYSRPGPAPQCPPPLETLGAALDNYDEIKAFYEPVAPAGGTPTGESHRETVKGLKATAGVPSDTPRFVVLCTDGFPDLCTNGDADGREDSLAATGEAFTADGIKTFVIGIGSYIGTPDGRSHLQALADVGVGFGLPGGSAAAGTFYLAENQASLTDAINTIINGVRPCSFALDKAITNPAVDGPKGSVTIDDGPVTFNDPDGWQFGPGGASIEFVGGACTTIQTGEHDIKASFPCGTATMPPPPR